MAESRSSKVVTFATVRTLDDEELIENVLRNYDGSLIRAHCAPLIRALAQGLGVSFNTVIPEDNAVGFKGLDGNWSGITGMLIRGEADLSGFPITLYQDKIEAVNFTFPLHVSDVIFMTTKPEPHPKHFAIFEVFVNEVWIAIILCILSVSLLFYFLLNGKEAFSNILFESAGCLLEQSYSFQVRQRNTVALLLHWLVGITVLTTSYKAVILSVMTLPRMVGIRDIKDLSKAASEKSVMCMTYRDCATDVWFDSKEERFKSIGECLKRGASEKLYYWQFLTSYPHKKAFIATRLDINKFSRDYLLSEDSFSVKHHSVLFSNRFCCPKKLGIVVRRIVEAGLYLKLQRDRDFTAQLIVTKPNVDDYDDSTVKRLTLKDFTGAFLVLIIGHVCALVVFIAEFVVKHSFTKTFKQARHS